ncbi:MAG: AAA family ATPase, partial [Desulfovibrionaceae bacterium]|nr:AAA family ATPase [Desulfovibrionaceae bacterium]
MLYFESFADIELDNYCLDASQLPQRRMCKHFIQYLQSTLNQAENKIAVLYGLYSTGKSTMLKQGAALVGGRKAVFINIKDKTADFIKIIEKIEEFKNAGKTYFFIDEITMLEDFPYLISAIVKLCEENCTFSLSGNDSLQFYLAKDEELYDKHLFYHTTFLPYIDYKHINKYNQVQCSMDDYIKITSNSARQSDHIQKNNVHDYIYTAIARNIYNTLSRRFSGENLGILNKLYAEN